MISNTDNEMTVVIGITIYDTNNELTQERNKLTNKPTTSNKQPNNNNNNNNNNDDSNGRYH